jgi:nitroreductase
MKIKEQIEKRKSIREFRNKALSPAQIEEIETYFKTVPVVDPSVSPELRICTGDAGIRLEGIAGYQGKAFGAPAYLIILSDKSPYYRVNAGFIGENLLLKLTDMGLDSCWLTLDDSNAAKKALQIQSDKHIAVVIAVGYGKREFTLKRLDIKNPANVTFKERKGHIAPKIAQSELVYLHEWGKPVDWHENSIDPMLDEAFYAASLAPSFLNRQPYRYVLLERRTLLFVKKEDLASETDTWLDAGATMFNFYITFHERNTGIDHNWVTGETEFDAAVNAPDDWRMIASYEW